MFWVTGRQWPNPNVIINDETKKDQIKSEYQMENALSKMKHSPEKPWVSNLETEKSLVLKSWPSAWISLLLSVWLHVTYTPPVWRREANPSPECRALSEDNIVFISPPQVAVTELPLSIPRSRDHADTLCRSVHRLSLQHSMWDTCPFTTLSVTVQVLFPLCSKYYQLVTSDSYK